MNTENVLIDHTGESSTQSLENSEETCFGQSLLKFMTLATGSVKTALQKPENYKKNINHRRYLQKQLKICPRRKRRNTKGTTAHKKKNNNHIKAQQNLMFNKSNNEVFPLSNGEQIPQNNMFVSHNTAQVLSPSTNEIQTYLANDIHSQYAWNSFACSPDYGNQTDPVSPLTTLCTNSFVRDDSFHGLINEESEQFLTGEELTQVLDIKDLFVPEKTLKGHEESDDVGLKTLSCRNFEENVFDGFQTVPTTMGILTW